MNVDNSKTYETLVGGGKVKLNYPVGDFVGSPSQFLFVELNVFFFAFLRYYV